MADASPENNKDPFGLCGTTIEGKYRIASVVGDGGFGVVYRGVHKGFGELIAVKCLKLPQSLDEAGREEFLEQLRDEGRLLHRLSRATPGIVQALDVGAVTTPAGVWVPYLVLEWLEGETLADLLKKGESFTLSEAIRLLEPAARALAVAHAQKVAHRDVKPPNLFVTEVAGKKTRPVLDFGIAKVLAEHPSVTEALAATKLGPTAFTPRYGAPEQFNKKRGASGPWTDVFALALIFVEILTGKKALDGDDPTELYIASADPASRPTPAKRGASVPEAVERVLEKALSVEPKNRYVDAGEFWDALVEAAGEETTLNGDKTTRDAALVQTMPAESLPKKAPDGAPSKPSVTKPSVSKPSKPRNVDTTDDPMAETPLLARVPSAPPPPAPVEAENKPKSRSATAWVIGAILIGGAAGVLYLQSGDHGGLTIGPIVKPTAMPSARHPIASAAHSASAAPIASASAPASASVAVAPAVPDDMARFAPATLKLGDGADAREVTITRAFFLDKREVRAKDYAACVNARKCSAALRVSVTPEGADAGPGPSEFVDQWSRRCTAASGESDHPVNCVDFANADSYCRFRGMRLPTEAEWEMAARGGAPGRAFPWGDTAPDCDRTCFDRNIGRCRRGDVSTCVSGAFPGDKTPEGIFDLGGGVAEWVADGWSSPAPGGSDPKGPAESALRVVRGGSFLSSDAGELRTGWRTPIASVTASVGIGFRCAMDAPP